ncbi:MAG: M1 family metallopeptidase [Gammaproteobacteria bacterium]|nr:M1 family metallopeptidase [Gammaproteobacteria bacterium]
MKTLKSAGLVMAVCSLLACGQNPADEAATEIKSDAASPASDEIARADADAISSYEYKDVHSFARPDEARVVSAHLDIAVDFDSQVLTGKAALMIEREQGADEVVLDTRRLDIESVSIGADDKLEAATWDLRPEDPNLGRALVIRLPDTGQNKLLVTVAYRTSPEASGLQWLQPAQTAGKQHPFLFTQSQAIHARSWIPLQDTPGVRMTYTATVRVPAALRAVMSAANDTSNALHPDGIYQFEMPQAIPSYLIALGVGDLVFVPMSERTGVFAEPDIAQAAAREFADTERMLQISEKLYGPYRWGRYDLLILPPSFPFGGMENPRLSFITPTVIAGDKSLVSLIAHELAHSWSGNLVTNATWRDLWLNEGFTSFLTTRIMEAVYGKARADMEYYLDLQGLREQMATLDINDQMLAIDSTGRDPDDVFSNVPYTKGQMFLSWLEQQYGREAFDVFLREYFDKFAFTSITTDEFLAYLDAELMSRHPGKVTRAQIDQWVFAGGLPSTDMVPESDAFSSIDTLSSAWVDRMMGLDEIDTRGWSVHEWLYFLNNLPTTLSTEDLRALDAAFDLTRSTNSEIAHSWFRHVIRNNYAPAYSQLEEYLIRIGRRKLIVPLYQELVKTPENRQFAERVYALARPGYHPLAQGTVDAIISKSEGE